ncbi:zinc metalloprotease [Sphingomonas yabuuchiae]|uniref:Zinc metalloprotease n=1 Tax=Sphingomonas yabuuchiae TaxID=172044 RepID=A0A147IM40_9SPHN|nr:neutral zinc metallopeptidase [Sphingomonas yabuuchiae]KTT96287.1 zinc metalloprotease [Sphingomonas yabuuchiae]
MRLDDYDNNIDVGEAQSGGGFGGGGGGGLLFGLLPLIGSRFGCGGIVVVLIILAVVGMNPLGLLTGGGGGGNAPVTRSADSSSGQSVRQICEASPERRDTCRAFSNADNTWEKIFAESGQRFQAPGLRFFKPDANSARSGCGVAQSAIGPFYCPTDRKIYLDTSFFNELANRFGAKGDFARYYVVAHEFGHHIQTLLGTSDKVRQAQQAAGEAEGNALSVRLELQADCYAGVWAAKNRDRLEPGDVEEGMTAARAIGDDTLQREATGRVVPDSFTHGTSEQRMRWLRRGIETGDPAQCDTFSGAI